MAIKLQLLNAGGGLNSYQMQIKLSFEQAIQEISKLIPISNIDVVIRAGSDVIPEIGLAGYSPTKDCIYLTIDPNNSKLKANFEKEFMPTLAHEFHHCLRHGTQGYGHTLEEALVTEGLACHFETELRDNKQAPFYATALTTKELKNMWQLAKPELKTNGYNHNDWFFGSEIRKIPRHSGYSLGFDLVSKYIQKNNAPASKLWDVSSRMFY